MDREQISTNFANIQSLSEGKDSLCKPVPRERKGIRAHCNKRKDQIIINIQY